MTRANINIKVDPIKPSQMPKWFYHYHNGDQYPDGMREWFGIIDLLKIRKPNGFDIVDWFSSNYRYDWESGDKMRELDRPCIYYDESGFITDYSYLVSFPDDEVIVYNWQDKIFSGTLKEAIKWFQSYGKQDKTRKSKRLNKVA